ncbi:hypothetical protein ACJX0J_010117, partial [Zea mays]
SQFNSMGDGWIDVYHVDYSIVYIYPSVWMEAEAETCACAEIDGDTKRDGDRSLIILIIKRKYELPNDIFLNPGLGCDIFSNMSEDDIIHLFMAVKNLPILNIY